MAVAFPFWKPISGALPPAGERVKLRFSQAGGTGEAWGERKVIDGKSVWSFDFNGARLQPLEWQVVNKRQMEMDSVRDYNPWANECSANADSDSKKLFEDLVVDEERHYDQYDNEIDNLDRFGKEYLALQSIGRGKNGAMGVAAE